jgi:DNA-binding NtrC family response regulator
MSYAPCDHSKPKRKPRRVLLVASHSPPRLTDELIDAGWEPVSAADAQRARELPCGQGIAAGLVQIPEADTDGRLLLELASASGPGVQWIALLDRAHLNHPEIRRNVSRYCYDFCIMPVPTDRLLVTLGQACGMDELRKAN